MKKTFLALLAALACGVSAMAGINTLVVTSGGESTNIALNDKPVVAVSDDALVITTESATLTYSTDKKITFKFKDSAGIEDLVSASKPIPTFYYEGNALSVYNLKPGSVVALFGLNGMVYYQGHANADGNLLINLEPYANGVIIVKTANKSIKIAKK